TAGRSDDPSSPASTFTNFRPVDVQTAVSCESDDRSPGHAWPSVGASAPKSIAATTIQFSIRATPARIPGPLIRWILHDGLASEASGPARRPPRDVAAAQTNSGAAHRRRRIPSMRRMPAWPRDPDWLDREYNARAAIPDSAAIF